MRSRCLTHLRLVFLVLGCPFLVLSANSLIINELTRNPAAIIYELPDPDGRDEAVRYIQSIRDRFWGDAEMLDATALSEAALQQKFQQKCVLYTTLGKNSRLVRLATPNMGWAIRDGIFHWQDVAIPLAGTRFILAAKNPYADGYIAVYAGGSNHAVVNINAVFHGPASFHVFSGGELWKEGFYGATLLPRQAISKAEAVEDIEQFFTTLERVHPNLLVKLDKSVYRQLRQSMAQKLNAKEQVAIEELAWLLYYAAARFQDGHTSARWRTTPTIQNTAGRRFPAFRLSFDNGRFLIVAARDKASEGTELVAINGVPIREFLRPILDRCSGETMAYRATHFTNDQYFWFYLANLFRSAEPLRLTLRDTEGRERQELSPTLDFSEYREFLERTNSTRLGSNQPDTRVEFLADGAVARFIYRSFRLSDAEKKRVDQIFHQIRAKGSRNLIIDLRGNGGGNSAMGDYIFSYLYDRPFRQFSTVKMKISPEVREYIRGWKKGPARLPVGKVVKRSTREVRIPKPEAFFSGRKYLLTDNETFSSAASFTAMFRDYQVGTVLGHETGGLPISFGDGFLLATFMFSL